MSDSERIPSHDIEEAWEGQEDRAVTLRISSGALVPALLDQQKVASSR